VRRPEAGVTPPAIVLVLGCAVGVGQAARASLCLLLAGTAAGQNHPATATTKDA
jgi:hypothetical protein